MATRTYRVEGMSCGHCKQSVEESLSHVPGVVGATADVDAGTVEVDGDAEDAAVTRAIEDAGYEVVLT